MISSRTQGNNAASGQQHTAQQAQQVLSGGAPLIGAQALSPTLVKLLFAMHVQDLYQQSHQMNIRVGDVTNPELKDHINSLILKAIQAGDL